MTLWVLCEHGKQNAHAVRETFCGDESCPVHGRMSSQGCPGGRQATPEDLIEALGGEKVWICGYPEFGDLACMDRHEPRYTNQPRKHTTCGWFFAVPESALTPALDQEKQ